MDEDSGGRKGDEGDDEGSDDDDDNDGWPSYWAASPTGFRKRKKRKPDPRIGSKVPRVQTMELPVSGIESSISVLKRK